MNETADKLKYIDVTPVKNGCRILAAGSFEEDKTPALMVNHIPVPFKRAAASDGTDLIWTDFFFPAVHLKITLEDEVIAQVEQEELTWMQENASLYLDVKESRWEGTRLILSGRVVSPFLETVRLSIQDEWGRPVEALITRSRDEGMEKAGLDFEDCFEMEINPADSRQLWLVMEDSRHLIREQLNMPPVSEQQKSITEKAMEFVSMGIGPAFYKIKNHFVSQNRADGYHAWFESQKPDRFRLEAQRNTKFVNPPKISLAVPAWNTPLEYFDEMADSVLEQTYPNWQLCIADGSDNDILQKHVAEKYGSEPRIVYRRLEKNYGISGNMNEAVKMCSGDYIGFFDHDDLLTPDALFEAAKVMEASLPDLIYTDEDKLNDETKTYCEPHFKPDFNMDQLLCHNYITHLTFVSRVLMDRVGWFDSSMDGSQDYDFILRAVEKARGICHIPKILYHWRMHPASTAQDSDSKDYCIKAGQLALTCYLNRNHLSAQVHSMPKPYDGMFWMQPFFAQKPQVSVITAFADDGAGPARLYQSLEASGWDSFEMTAIDMGEPDRRLDENLAALAAEKKIRILEKSPSGNLADHLNDASQLAAGKLLLFINPTARLIHPQALSFMAFKALMKDHGAVTGKILDAEKLVWAFGETADQNGSVKRNFVHLDENHPGHMGRALVSSRWQMVPIDLLMIQTDKFMQAGGFLPEFAAGGMAEDLCLRLQNQGYINAGTANAQIQIDKPWNRLVNLPDTAAAKAAFYDKWDAVLKKPDPAYNPNFDIVAETFVLPQ